MLHAGVEPKKDNKIFQNLSFFYLLASRLQESDDVEQVDDVEQAEAPLDQVLDVLPVEIERVLERADHRLSSPRLFPEWIGPQLKIVSARSRQNYFQICDALQ